MAHEATGKVLERRRHEETRGADGLAGLRRENERLRGRVHALASALHGLAEDLAASRRTCSLREAEIAVLQAGLRVASEAASGGMAGPLAGGSGRA